MLFACTQRWPPARQRLKNCAVCAGACMLATTTACRCKQKYSTVTGCCSSAAQMRAAAVALWGFSFTVTLPRSRSRLQWSTPSMVVTLSVKTGVTAVV